MEKPSPPSHIPKYVVDGVTRQDTETLRAIIGYCEDLIDYYNRDIDPEELKTGDGIVDVEEGEGGVMIVTKKQQCGKNCSGCPHGPYKWRVTPADGGGKNWECLGLVSD